MPVHPTQAVRQVLGDQVDTGWRITMASPISPVEHVAKPDTVLHQQGLVQTVARNQWPSLLRRRTDLHHVVDRVARHQVDDHEDDQRHRQEYRQQQHQPLKQKANMK